MGVEVGVLAVGMLPPGPASPCQLLCTRAPIALQV